MEEEEDSGRHNGRDGERGSEESYGNGSEELDGGFGFRLLRPPGH